jgi:hypothetical protein
VPKTYGDIRDLMDDDLREDTLVCGCGQSVTINLDHWGLDWPEKLDGWRKTDTGYACPRCRALD